MATQETQILDSVVASTRRKMLTLGGAALAGLAFGPTKAASAATIGDSDILNFALNLEYLEANFYTLATAGTTIDQMGLGIGAGTTATGTATVITKPGGPTACKVPWAIPVVQAYAQETANEERLHVTFLRTALAGAAVAEPNLDLYNSFIALGAAVGVSGFDPFASDANFLLGAYIFEDVGVTAYGGAAGLLASNAYLMAAAGILAVEAYHAGLVRTTIFNLDTAGLTTNPATLTYSNLTQAISAKRSAFALPYVTNGYPEPDDIGNTVITTPLNSSSTTAKGITLADVNTTNSLAFVRNTNQVLAIVTAPQGTSGNFKGGFFPNGLNGLIS